ncbi:MAG: hypothetical protein NZ581_09010 [Candidatus Caldarchaeum sp.]|nr:hypothetical protein [Candidatus Caldarchaeum sp.]MDW8436312.1 hypothetical protein [Candidatus Caldarchaeum sp.]
MEFYVVYDRAAACRGIDLAVDHLVTGEIGSYPVFRTTWNATTRIRRVV